MSEIPWDFFKYIYVVNLKDDVEKRKQITEMLESRGCTKFTMFDATNGKKHPTLRKDYVVRGLIGADANITLGALGCYVSHRSIWEAVYNTIDSNEPFWTLIFEDDAQFHPLITNEKFMEYIRRIPLDAKYVKFGHHIIPGGYSLYKQKNKYWVEMNNAISYGTYCYAVRSDMLPMLLGLKNLTVAIDCISLSTGFYGACDPEDVYSLEKSEYADWRVYYDPYSRSTQEYRGIVGCSQQESSTFDESVFRSKNPTSK